MDRELNVVSQIGDQMVHNDRNHRAKEAVGPFILTTSSSAFFGYPEMCSRHLPGSSSPQTFFEDSGEDAVKSQQKKLALSQILGYTE